eukprot:TRINITY_DN30998_c0_g1_i1.p2 TRINITY_DN30998_c0_g1~~TRINITY_DN30998_c0_g1_i1.p2  ORF type:complete len:205 (+),score=33.84 TRINITY_DN30998_c0_g1_i1:641-1255(+)
MFAWALLRCPEPYILHVDGDIQLSPAPSPAGWITAALAVMRSGGCVPAAAGPWDGVTLPLLPRRKSSCGPGAARAVPFVCPDGCPAAGGSPTPRCPSSARLPRDCHRPLRAPNGSLARPYAKRGFTADEADDRWHVSLQAFLGDCASLQALWPLQEPRVGAPRRWAAQTEVLLETLLAQRGAAAAWLPPSAGVCKMSRPGAQHR